ncbi:MAG: CvpA family protein [Betaproteobacteria bacterium]|nr:CvpA family protein [Betaproteobacteria bacterium]
MTVFDYAFLSILGLSATLGLWRGLTSEVLGLAGLVLALVTATHYADVAAHQFENMIDDPRARVAAAFALILFAVLLVVSLAKLFLRRLLCTVGLGATDRFFGAVFGIVRGLMIVLIVVWVGGLIGMSREPWWERALFAPLLEKAVSRIEPWLPDIDSAVDDILK